MHPILRNILALLLGLFVGGILNGKLIAISGQVVPLPDGVNPNDLESIKANMHLYQIKHFVMPFIAHAAGTFVGAFLTSLIVVSHRIKWALAIGFIFFIGGAMMVYMLPSPLWFNIVDLCFAYIPMAWFAAYLAQRLRPHKL